MLIARAELILEGRLAHSYAKHAILYSKRAKLQRPSVQSTTFCSSASQGRSVVPSRYHRQIGRSVTDLQEKYPAGKRLKSLGGVKPRVNLVRYADDFVITAKSKELLEGEIKPLIEQFLQERGLELSPTKTVITHVEHGFDFLGQNVRRYPNGKLLIKPSKKNVGTFLDSIRRIIKTAHGVSAADLIDQLNPKIRGWANYHRHVVSKRTFGHVDRNVFSSLWQWARRRHLNKSPRWFKPKYSDRRGNRDWSFFGETCDDEGRPTKVWLHYAMSTPVRRASVVLLSSQVN
jgi:RNA-directed DNA polymerase